MDQQSLPTSQAPQVVIDEVHGNLQVKGWDRSEVVVKARQEDITQFEENEDVVHLSCTGDCTVRLPQGASLQMGILHGSARVKLLEDSLQIDQALGGLVLRNVGDAKIGQVHGDLLVKQILGDLQVDEVLGSSIVRDVQGDCAIQQTSGNLDLRDTLGNLSVSISGNARVRLSLLAGDNYAVNAGGNLHCRIAEDASAEVSLSSGAQDIRVKLPDVKKIYNEGSHHLTLGHGDAKMNLTAGGMIFLGAQETDWGEVEDFDADFSEDFAAFSEEFSQQIESQIESQMEMLNEQMANLSDRMGEVGLSQVDVQKMMERARVSSEQATLRAQEKMRRTQEKIARKMAAAQRKAELKAKAAERRAHVHGRHGWNFEWTPTAPPPPRPPQEPKEPVSDEERMMILRMLEQKKITIDEAEKLLAALEGKES